MGSWSSWHYLTPGRYHKFPGEKKRDSQQSSEEQNPREAGAMEDTGFSAPLMCFDSLSPHMVIVDGIIRKKKKHTLARSSHSCERRADSEDAEQSTYGFPALSGHLGHGQWRAV